MRSSYNYPEGVTDRDIDEHFGEPEQKLDDGEYNDAVWHASIGWILDAIQEDER